MQETQNQANTLSQDIASKTTIDGTLTPEEVQILQQILSDRMDILDDTTDKINILKDFIVSDVMKFTEDVARLNGFSIEELQRALNAHMPNNTIIPDDDFWPKTFRSIAMFQARENLEVDGVLWQDTLTALFWKREIIEERRGRNVFWRFLNGISEKISQAGWTIKKDVRMTAYSGQKEKDHAEHNNSALDRPLRYSEDPDQPTSAAANWAIYPIGTQFRVDGKLYEVDDYGSYISENPETIDLYFPTNTGMNGWWRKTQDIVIERFWDPKMTQEFLQKRVNYMNKINKPVPKHLTVMLQGLDDTVG